LPDPRAKVIVRDIGNSYGVLSIWRWIWRNKEVDAETFVEPKDAIPVVFPVLDVEIPVESFWNAMPLLGPQSASPKIIDRWPSVIPANTIVWAKPELEATGPDTQLEPSVLSFPQRLTGRLYCMRDGQSTEFGTGWVIGPNHILTAAHCLHSNANGWVDEVWFVSGSNTEHERALRCTQIASAVGWSKDNPQGKGPDAHATDFFYDFAILRTNEGIGNVLGSLGWARPLIGQEATSLGYPEDTNGDLTRSTGRVSTEGDFLKMRNDMKEGCSGGPVVSWEGGKPYAVGINGFRTQNDQELYSPPLGEVFSNLIEWANKN